MRPGPGAVGVVRDDRNALSERPFDRRLERLLVDDADGDAGRFGADGRVECVDHLAHVGFLRAAPRVGDAEQRARIGAAVLGRNEEGVRRDVVDERELPLRMAWKGGCGTVRGAER